jgi:hypothetical protein
MAATYPFGDMVEDVDSTLPAVDLHLVMFAATFRSVLRGHAKYVTRTVPAVGSPVAY